jgi:hypothetical protein
MKRSMLYLLSTIVVTILTAFAIPDRVPAGAPAESLRGAWTNTTAQGKTVMIFSDNVFSVANYDVAGKKFISSSGGTWRVDGDRLARKTEWNSADSAKVGTEQTESFAIAANRLRLQAGENWERLDNGTPGELAGVWIITGNYNNDKVSKRASPFFPRRTMKVLSGKYFHWIAYNVTTKQFLNAGGGTYTTANGKYTENIEFFTKTPESIGKSLVFDYSFVMAIGVTKGKNQQGARWMNAGQSDPNSKNSHVK